MPKAETVRVRVAVAVDARGNIGVGTEVSDAVEFMVDDRPRHHAGEPHHVVWLEAEVPLPKSEPLTIPATVSEATS